MGERIRRTDLNQLMREYKGGGFFNHDAMESRNFLKLPKAYVNNSSSGEILIGERVWVSGPRDLTIAEMQQQYLTDGFLLSREGVGSTWAVMSGIALEPIKSNGIGEIYIPGLSVGWATCTDDSHRYVKITYQRNTATIASVSSSYNADFAIVGRSTDSNDSNKRFLYIAPYVQKDRYYGHRTGYYRNGSVYSDSNYNNLIQSNVPCPLLRTGESIEAGAKVIMSWNQDSEIWQIIEAQCPQAQASPLPGGDEEGSGYIEEEGSGEEGSGSGVDFNEF